jgi:hypothetical protein
MLLAVLTRLPQWQTLQTEAFNRKGVDQVVCITPMSPEELRELSSRPELKSSKAS